MTPARTLAWDWYPGTIPDNVVIDETAYVETSFSFHLYRGEEPGAVSCSCRGPRNSRAGPEQPIPQEHSHPWGVLSSCRQALPPGLSSAAFSPSAP